MPEIKWAKREDVEPADVSERQIQQAFEEHLSELEDGLEYVHSFVKTQVGTIDSLAIDADRHPVILEFKKPDQSERDALIQALDYFAYCRQHIDWLHDYIVKAKPELKPFAGELSEEIRIVIVAKEFEERVRRAVAGVEPEVLLTEYSLRWDASGKIELSPNIVVDTSLAVAAKRPPLPMSVDDHFRNKEAMKPVFDKLVEEVKEFDGKLQLTPTQYYINLWVGYCGVIIRQRHIIINARAKINKPNFREWASDSAWGKAGFGGQLPIRSADEIDTDVISWLRSVYEKTRQ